MARALPILLDSVVALPTSFHNRPRCPAARKIPSLFATPFRTGALRQLRNSSGIRRAEGGVESFDHAPLERPQFRNNGREPGTGQRCCWDETSRLGQQATRSAGVTRPLLLASTTCPPVRSSPNVWRIVSTIIQPVNRKGKQRIVSSAPNGRSLVSSSVSQHLHHIVSTYEGISSVWCRQTSPKMVLWPTTCAWAVHLSARRQHRVARVSTTRFILPHTSFVEGRLSETESLACYRRRRTRRHNASVGHTIHIYAPPPQLSIVHEHLQRLRAPTLLTEC